MSKLPQFNDYETTTQKLPEIFGKPISLQYVEPTSIYDKKCVIIEYFMSEDDTRYQSYVMDRQMRAFFIALDNGNHLPIGVMIYQDKTKNNRASVQYVD